MKFNTLKMASIRGALLASTVISGLALAVPVAMLVAPTAANAQDYTSGNLSGDVTDNAGASVSGAKVTITSQQGSVYETTTSSSGSFEVRALSVGTYNISITKDGYSETKSTVSLAPIGSSYSFVMDGGVRTGTIVVRGKRKSDFNKTETGSTIDVQELANKVPIGRSINSVVMLTPGASLPDATINAGARRNQSLVSLSGTSAAESSYYINGMQVTDQRTFLGYADLPFDFIDRIETKTGGYMSEFGRGTGGVVNMVTRSGTNEFEWGFSAFTSPKGLRSSLPLAYAAGGSNSLGQLVYNQYASSNTNEYSIYAGGPIIKDHLFYFVNYNPRENTSWGAATFSTPTTSRGTQTFSTYNDARWGAKIDFVINPNHKIEYTIFDDSTTTDYQPYEFLKSKMNLGNAALPYWEESGGTNQILKYTGKITDWFTISALVGRAESMYRDYGPATTEAAVFDWYSGVYLDTNRFASFDIDGNDVRDTYRIDADFYFSALGDHHIRVGYDREDLTTFAKSYYNGGAIYYTGYAADLEFDITPYPSITADTPLVNKITFANDGTFQAEQTAIYIQDSWKLSPYFTLQLGLRNDIYDYKNIQGASYIKIDNQIAPRIGFNWDPFKNGTDKVFGFAGDYYLPIATNTSVRSSSGEIYTDQYFVGQRDSSENVIRGSHGIPVMGSLITTNYLSPPGAPDPRAVVEADLEPMYEREYIIGYEHTFDEGRFANWRVGLKYVQRELQSTIEDTAIGDAVMRYCARTNASNCGSNPDLYPYVLINPGNAARVYVDLQGDAPALGDGSANPLYNPQYIDLTAADLALPEVNREYKALELTFQRPFDGKWSLAGSYTLARSYGNYEGAVKSDIGQTDASITQDFDHSAIMLNSTGYLPNHHTHTIKLYGNYVFNDIFSVGANFTAQSGRKYGCIGYAPLSADPLAPQDATPSAWFCPGNVLDTSTAVTNDYVKVATPRGASGETDWVTQLDLNLNVRLYQSETRGTANLTIDVFNVFDEQTATRVVETGEVRVSAGGATGRKPSFYGMPRSYQSPRSVRLGIKYRF